MSQLILNTLLESTSNVVKKEDLVQFEWYTFNGLRKKTVTKRTHIKDIVPGQTYGLRPIRGGSFYLILPEIWNIPFTVEPIFAKQLTDKSTKKRKMPKLVDVREGRQRALRKTGRKVDTSSDRFKPQNKVRDERNGLDFGNYQWRKLLTPKYAIKKTNKIGTELVKGQSFGVRFIKPATGGVLVLEDGKRFSLTTVAFDTLMVQSLVLPLNQWQDTVLNKDDIANNEQKALDKKEQAKIDSATERRKLSAERKKNKIKQDAEIKKAKQSVKEQQRLKMIDLKETADKAQKVVFSPVSRIDPVGSMISNLRSEDDLANKLDKLADEDVDLDLDDLEVVAPDKEDETIDEEDVEIADADQDAVESALDEQIDEDREEARTLQIVDEDDEDEVDFDEEDEEDAEAPDLDSMDEQEIIDLAKEIGAGNLKFDRAREALVEHYGIEEEEEPEEEDTDLDEENEDAAIEEALDSDEDIEETDDDMEELEDAEEEPDDVDADEEEPEAEEESEEEEDFEVQDIIVFNEDKTEKREFVILDINALKKSDNITVYKLFNLSDEDNTSYQTARFDTKKKNTIEKMAKKVGILKGKRYAEVFNAIDTYEKSKEPLTS